jgi:hypothetical protein
MAIVLAPTPALACVTDVTGKGHDDKAVVVLVAVFVPVINPREGRDGGGPRPTFVFMLCKCSIMC